MIRRIFILGATVSVLLILNHCIQSYYTPVDKLMYLGQMPPGKQAAVFAAGTVSTPRFDEYGCTFSPDGREFYFTRTLLHPRRHHIQYCVLSDSGWSQPRSVFFNGVNQAGEPVISPDGQFLYFGRLVKGDTADAPASQIWRCRRENHTWQSPQYLFPGMYASVSRDNTVYFTDVSGGYQHGDIARTRLTPVNEFIVEKLPVPVNSEAQDAHPFIDPGGQYLLFDSDRPGGYGNSDLYVSFLTDGKWGKPINLGPSVNTDGYEAIPSVSPDGNYLFFCRREAQGDIYWISAAIIADVKPPASN